MVAKPANAEQQIRDQEIRISTISMWSDRIWQLDVDVPGTTPADLAIDWGIAFVDGSRFTDKGWAAWREAARCFLWSLRVTPPPGRRRARGTTLSEGSRPCAFSSGGWSLKAIDALPTSTVMRLTAFSASFTSDRVAEGAVCRRP